MGTSAPAVHSVHFYDKHEDLIERLRGIVSSGLAVGNSVLIVATPEHRHQLAKSLEKSGTHVRKAEREGRFVICDAAETLATFMTGNKPDPKRFLQSVGKLLAGAKGRR